MQIMTSHGRSLRSLLLIFLLTLVPWALYAAPALVEISPPSGSLLEHSSVTLEGRAEGAKRATIDGQEVRLDGDGRFSAGPFKLEDGERRFLIVLENAEGQQEATVHAVTADTRPPILQLDRLGSVTSSREISISGSAVDPHLRAVTVADRPAKVVGGRFTAPITLKPGAQQIEVIAVDALGHESRAELAMELDLEAPALALLAAGEPLAGQVSQRGLRPQVEAGDAERIELLLDGRPFEAGGTIEIEGTHRLDAIAFDAAGNRAETSATFTIDRTPPSLGAVKDRGKVFRDRNIYVEGSVEGAISVTVDGQPATLSGDSYRAGPFTLDGGERVFRVVARDAAGNERTASVPYKNDPDAPVLTVTTPTDGAVVGASPITVSGTAVDADLATVTVQVAGGASVDATLSGDAFTASVALAEGSNSITVTATDAVVHTSDETRTVILDTAAPVIQLTAAGSPITEGAIFAGLVTPSIVATDATEVTLSATLGGLPYSSGTSITEAGSHELNITATDAAGNSSSLLRTFTIEAAAPVFSNLAPAAGSILATAEVRLSGRAAGATSLTVDGQAVTLVGGDFTTAPIALSAGSRTFTLVATSAGGQSTNQTLTIIHDAAAPTVAITSPADGDVGADGSLSVAGTVSDAHFESLTVNGAAATITGDPATGATFTASVVVSEGSNRLRAVAVDQAGNTSNAEISHDLDTRAPELSILDPAAGTVVGTSTLTVSGRVADAHLDRVEIAGVTATLAGAAGERTWSADISLVTGTSTLTATAFDTLGQSASATLEVTREDGAPSLTITSPAEGTSTQASTIDVTGTVATGATVTVNGADAAVTSGTFQITGVELSEGENSIIARATITDQGNTEQSTLVRTVIRDSEAPTVLGANPADGSEGIARDNDFKITFSEPLATPAAGAWRLETTAGAAIPATGSFDESALASTVFTVRPQGLLPPATEIRLVATTAFQDPAGHALAAAQTWTYTTLADGAPAAPTLSPVPESVCANAVILGGTASAGAQIQVEGGGAAAHTRAADDGTFSVEVALEPGRLHLLGVSSVDAEGRVSATAWAEVAQDCAGPQILGAERLGDTFQLTFDGAIDAPTLGVTVSDASGALAGSVAVDASGESATWTGAAALPAGVLRLEVAATLADAAGNSLGFPWVRLFGADSATTFLSGTVVDESTGRPLAGATVVVTRSGGVVTVDPRPEMTTGTDGRFLIAVGAGTHDLTVSRPGYSPVFRIATTLAGEGTEVFTPRLEPVGGNVTLGSAAGSLEAKRAAGGLARFELPANALLVDTDATLTALSEQSLPALLPYGWSPRGAAWLDMGWPDPAPTLQLAATLRVPVSAPPGTLLVLATLDLETLQWRAAAEQAVVGDADGTHIVFTLDATFAGLGAFAALEADAGALAPPAPVVGEVLGSSAAPASSEVLSATLSFTPEIVLPTQTADVEALYGLASEQPSGLPLTLVIQEELELVDGTLRREAPYRAQLVLYRDNSGQAASHFRLRPSALARTQPVRLGAEDVTVLRYSDESVRGNVLGPDGGSVLSDEGDRLEVQAGSLTEPTPIVLERRSVADLPLTAPTGGTVEAVLEIDLGDQELLQAGSLSFVIDPAPAVTARGLLLQVVELSDGPAYRAVAELAPTVTGYETIAIDPADLAWPGVRSGGLFVALTLNYEPAFIRGTTLGEDGLPLAGGVISSPQVDWVQISNSDGTYVLPVPTGDIQLDLFDPATGNHSTQTVNAAAADDRVEAGLQTTPTGPRVLSTTPADGAEVPAGIQPQISFSEAIDPSTVIAGIELRRGDEILPIAFDVQGALVTVLPAATLAPGAPYELHITGGLGDGIRDLQGYGLEQPVTVTFTISEVVLPNSIDLDKITLYAPVGGTSQIIGTAGSVPAGNLVWVENLTSYQTTESVTATQSGSFTLQIGADLGDEILFHVLVDGANEVVKLLGPYMSADRKGAFVGRRAATFKTADGVTVMADEGTFDSFTEVRVVPEGLATPPIPLPAPGVLEPIYAFALDFGGGEAQRPINLRVPAPANAQPEWYLLAKAWDLFGESLWSMKEIMVLDGAELTTEDGVAPPVSAATSGGGEALKSSGPASKAESGGPLKTGSSDPRSYEASIWSSGFFNIFRSNEPLGFAVLTVENSAVIYSDAVPGMVVEAADSLSNGLGFSQLAVPSLLGEDFVLHGTDARTGFELFRETFQPVSGPVQVLAPAAFGDTGRPFLTGGSPLTMEMVTATPGTREVLRGLRTEVSANRDSDGNLLSQQTLTVIFEKGSLIIDRRPDDDSEIPLEAKLTSMVDGTETSTMVDSAIETQDVTLSRSVTLGESFLLTIGAVLRLDQWIEMEWNEALDPSLEGFELELLGGNEPLSLEVLAEPVGTYEKIRMRPLSGWQPGKAYNLRLRGSIKDGAGNLVLPVYEPNCQEENQELCPRKSLTVRFETRGSQIFQGFNFTAVRDVERLGSLIFVAAGQQGLWVLDATEPRNLKNYFGGDLHFAFPLSDQVRGLAIDPHGRVIVTGGGLTGPGQVKILDPLAFPENPTTNADLLQAWRGSSLITDRIGTDELFASMPPTTPNHLEILSRDRQDSWTLGVDSVPTGLALGGGQVPTFDAFDLTITGNDGVKGQPVTLRNLTRGTWDRVDAGEGGQFSLTLKARHGERIQVLRNVDSLAYVQLDSYGLAAIDLNHFYGENDDANGDNVPDNPQIVQSQVLRYYTHSILENKPNDPLCDPNGLYLGDDPAFLATDFALLGRGANGSNGPWHLPVLMRSYGLVMVAIDGNNPVEINKVDWTCGVGLPPASDFGEVGYMTGLGVAEGFDALVVYDDDNILKAPEGARTMTINGQEKPVGREQRDYVFMGNSWGHIYVVDVTNRLDLRIVAKIELPTRPAGPITFDRENRRLVVAGGAHGVYMVDLNGPFPLARVDVESPQVVVDEDGKPGDDRVLEQIEVRAPIPEGGGPAPAPLNVNRRVVLWDDLGLAWIGGVQNLSNPSQLGLGGLIYRAPRVRFLGTGDEGLFEVTEVAPFGVPTAPVDPNAEGDDVSEHPGLVRVEMHLPGELADNEGKLRVDLVSVGAGGEEMTGAGAASVIDKLPPTSYRGADGLLLQRQSDKPWHEGYQIYLSEPIVMLADLRASYWYQMTDEEKEAKDSAGEPICRRCDLQDPEQGVYPQTGVLPAKVYREMLSGHKLALRLSDTTKNHLAQLYGGLLASQTDVEVPSVAWDISPSLQQEPFQNPNFGHGEVAPGTLVHSGEFTNDVVDLERGGVGFDFLFTRTYRNQTVGGGLLGPGWDFGYRARLRPLPDKSVDYFDGRGRRVTFDWNASGKVYIPPPGVFMTLNRDAAGYRIVDRSGSIMQFDRFGLLQWMSDVHRRSDKSGTEMRFEYDLSSRLVKVSAHGRGFDLEYDDDGRLKELVDDVGRKVTYHYDAQGRLTRVESPVTELVKGESEPGRLATTYTYENDASTVLRRAMNRRDNLASITDALGKTWLSLTWKAGDGEMGHQLATQTWRGHALSFEFPSEGDEITVTDRRGNEHKYRHNATGQATYYSDDPFVHTHWEYGVYGTEREQGLLRSTTLPTGRKLRYEYAEEERFNEGGDGLQIPQIELANVSKIEQVPGWGDPSMTGGYCDPDNASSNGSGPTLTWQYADHAQWTHEPAVTISPIGDEIYTDWDADERAALTRGHRFSTGFEEPEVVSTSDTVVRDEQGRVESKTHTNSDGSTVTTTYTYDSAGTTMPVESKVTVEGQDPFTIRIDKDNLGRVTKIEEPGNVERTWFYNSAGWLLESCDIVDGNSACTRYRYDKAGRVVKVEEPYGDPATPQHTATFFDYGEFGELLEVETEVTPGGARISESTVYDENYNVLEVDQTGRRKVTYTYDERDLVKTRTTFGDQGEERVEHFTYRRDGQLSTYTDALGEVWQTRYDGYGRSMQTIDPEMNRTMISYDEFGKPRRHLSCNSNGFLLSHRVTHLDGADRLIAEEHIDPKGLAEPSLTIFQYDVASNIVAIEDPADRYLEMAYDDLQRQTDMVVKESENGPELLRVKWSEPDARGNLRKKETFVTGAMANPLSYVENYQYDGYDRPKKMVSGLGHSAEFKYDIRGNLVESKDPEGFITTYGYDGLDRPTSIQRPQGIDISFAYTDAPDSSTVVYKDGKNQATTYVYDGLGLLSSVTYPDNTTETFTYDAVNNPTGLAFPDGTTLDQSFDSLGRLRSRVADLSSNLRGHTSETYDYDGLGRLTHLNQQGIVSGYTYDGLSQVRTETTGNHTVTSDYDRSGLRTAIDYPSNQSINQQFNSSGQLFRVVGDPGLGTSFYAAYGWQGQMRNSLAIGEFQSGTSGNDIVQGTYYRDADRRIEKTRFLNPADGDNLIFGERLYRDGRNLLTGHSYDDRGGQGWRRVYDDAGRLVEQHASGFGSDGTPADGGYVATSVASSFWMDLDEVDNLTERRSQLACALETEQMPLDTSKRNRPASVNGKALAYDVNGNLVQKGDLHFFYDFRHRLVEVKRQTGPAAFETVATYGYDGTNRRVSRTVGANTWRTAWDGWRPVEEYLEVSGDDVLMSRRFYGANLDEIIGLEIRPTAASTEMTRYVPLYDQVGNLAMLADTNGQPVERYDYSPHGHRFIWSDSTPPTLDQVLFKDGQLILELSEEVLPDGIDGALNSGLLLENTTKGLNIGLTLSQPIQKGRNARHRLVLTLEEPAQPEDRDVGDVLQLTVPSSAFEDFFGNSMVTDPTVPTFTWQPTGTEVVLDTAQPELVEACIVGGKLRLEFTETPNTASTDVIQLDGAAATWTLLADGYTLEMTGAVGAGAHTLSFTGDAFDLGGQALANTGTLNFDGADEHIWGAAFAGEIGILPGEYAARSAAGNPFGFKGLQVDPETGFYYVRHRYYDPELGRFLTPDPYGYSDSGNLYQFALNDPANLHDPTGQYVESPAELISIGMGLASLNDNAKNGRWGWVALDLAGLTFDTVALVLPGVPGFAGLALKGEKAVNACNKATRLATNIRRGQLAVQMADVGIASYQAVDSFRQGDTGWGLFNAGMALWGMRGVDQGLVQRTTCFTAGTPIWTADGELVPIEDIKVGDEVMSRNPETGETSVNKVAHLFVTDGKEILEIDIESADGEIETFEATPDHPFFSVDGSEVLAEDLRPGDQLAPSVRGETGLTVRDVRGSPTKHTVYNFEVENDHTYFVGEQGVWVHNNECDDFVPKALIGPEGDPGGANLIAGQARNIGQGRGPSFERAMQERFSKKIIRQNEDLFDHNGKKIGEIDFETDDALFEVGTSLGQKTKQLVRMAELARERQKNFVVLYDPIDTPFKRMLQFKNMLRRKFGKRVRFIPMTE